MADTGKEQLEISKQLLDNAKETDKVLRNQTQNISQQLDFMREMLDIAQKIKDSGFDKLAQSLDKLGDEMKDLKADGDEVKEMLENASDIATKDARAFSVLGEGTSDLAKQMKDAAGSASGLGKSLDQAGQSSSLAAAGWQRLAGALSIGGDMLKGLTSMIGTIIEYTFKLGVALVNVAVSAFKDFMDYAQESAKYGYDLARAIEKVRQNFGDLSGEASKAVVTAGHSMAGFADTGLSAMQVFGNKAEQMTAMNEMAVSLGGTFFALTDEVEKSGGAFLAFQKGLGLSAEAMKGVAQLSITSGKSFKETAREIEKFAIGVAGKSFKPLSRAMGEALKDVAHFGGATIQQIAQAGQYAHKLGVELNQIVGTLDAFETFDSAADNAAKLSQSFGVTIDAFKMMEAQSPDEQINALREAFRAAGVDSASFNRQQLKLLSSSVGLDAATAKQVFSLNNAGESLDKIKEKGDKAAKTQLTQQEAMKKLAESIERLIIELPKFDGLFDAFFKGFFTGMVQTGEAQKSLQEMMKTFQEIFNVGKQLGTFIANIPEVKAFFTDIRLIISNLDKPFKILSDNFKLLFQGKQGFGDFWTNTSEQITKAFSDGETSAAFSNVMDKLKGFAKIIARGLGSFLNFSFGQLGSLFTIIANWLTGKKEEKLPKDAQQSAASEIYDAFANELGDQKNIDKLDEGFQTLKKAVKEKLKDLWENDIKPWLKEEIPKLFSYLGEVMVEGLKGAGKFLLKNAGWIAGGVVLGGVLVSAISAAFGIAKAAVFTKTSELSLNLAAGLKNAANKSGPIMNKVLTGGSEAALKTAVNLSEKAAVASAGKVATQGAATLAAKGAAKGMLAKVGGKLVPGVSLAIGGYELYDAWASREKDSTLETVGKVISGASAIAATVPAVGTAIGIGGMLLGEGLKMLGSSQKTADQVKEAQNDVEESKTSIQSLTDAGTIDQMITAIKSAGRSGEINDTDLASFTKLMDTYKQVAEATGPLANLDLSGMVTGIQSVIVTSNAIYDATKSIPDDFSSIVGVKMFNLQTTFSTMQDVITSITKSTSNILSAGLTQNIENIGSIVSNINALNNSLALVEAVNVVAKVGEIATSLGVGGKGEYKVTRGDVNLTVNFTVVMDVDKTEKVMIMRKESVIRDRLNDAQSSHMSSEYSIPETYSPSAEILISQIDKAKKAK